MHFTLRNVLLWVHIVAVASWLGADILRFVIAPRFRKAGPAAELQWVRTVYFMHDRFYAIVAVLILLTGIGLVQESEWSWSNHEFIWVGLAAVALGGALGGGFLKAQAKKRIAALEAGNAADNDAIAKREMPVELFLTGFALLTVLAMVSKWGV